MHALFGVVVATIVLTLVGCPLESKSCTAIGCADGVSLTIQRDDEPWADGTYAITLATPETTHTCMLAVPGDLPEQPGSVHALTCEPQLYVTLVPQAVCTEQRSGDAISQTCTPVADRFLLSTQLYGTPETPETLHVRITRDGEELFDETQTLEYEESRPNGPDCEPLCRQAHLELTVR